jgi:hypothetical protein
VECKQLSSRSA